MMLHRTLACLLATGALASGDDPFEWAAIFDTPGNGPYKWTMQKVGGAYAEAHMKIVMLPVSASTDEALEAAEAEAKHSFEETCTEKDHGETIKPEEDKCWEIHFENANADTVIDINVAGIDHVAIFAEHKPSEFERDTHYLRDASGADVEYKHLLEDHAAHGAGAALSGMISNLKAKWGPAHSQAIGASLIVCVCTLIGLILLFPGVGSCAKKFPDGFGAIVNSFAGGALLSAAFYLLLYEGNHLIPIVGGNEGAAAADWGTMILFGFVTAPIIDIFVSAITCGKSDKAARTGDEEKGVSLADVNVSTGGHRARVLGGVLIGDFLHNICDGVFIGAAFLGCGTKKGWSVAAATVAHELAQEVADYVVLTDPTQGNLKPWKALLLNFFSGLSCLFGALVVLSLECVDNHALGRLLSYGAGVYIQIGAAECMPNVYRRARSTILRLVCLGVFCLGCFCIGIVLVDHQHCVSLAKCNILPGSNANTTAASGGHGAHAGHGH